MFPTVWFFDLKILEAQQCCASILIAIASIVRTYARYDQKPDSCVAVIHKLLPLSLSFA
ncbi:MAG: hypothetical protein KME52_25850 [Desmonostoc geniculatum HA4340-LM1]|nr:hypothetical protein [Desmonostoc geniculatum HA4340-LM1]